jgi:membrane-associated phospholipid phosphatase
MFKRLNRQERVLVERWLSPSAPSWGLTAVTEAARGGALWLCGAAGLALWPGRWRAGARDAAVAVAVASGFAHSIGHVLVRQRPAASRLPAYEAMTHKATSASFPSAHAAVAAAFTTALTRRIGAAGLVTVPVAGVVAYSRVRMRAHWPSDVVVGIGQGVVVGEVVHRLMSGTVNFRQPASAVHRAYSRLVAMAGVLVVAVWSTDFGVMSMNNECQCRPPCSGSRGDKRGAVVADS